MKIKLGKPVRFLGISWSEPAWEFDSPYFLLYPVQRYSTNHAGLDGLIEDTCIDIVIAIEDGIDIKPELNAGDKREFNWRGWKIESLKRTARKVLAGQKFPVKNYRVVEEYYVFEKDLDNPEEIIFKTWLKLK